MIRNIKTTIKTTIKIDMTTKKIIGYIAIFMLLMVMCLFFNMKKVYAKEQTISDGEYEMEVQLEGGSGKASIQSPAVVTVKDGKAYGKIEWSSSNYDYMLVDGEKYFPINDGVNSVFEIPVSVFNSPIQMIADTTAMSTPHEVEYTITFYTDSLDGNEQIKESKSWVRPYGYVIGITIFLVGMLAFLLYKKKNSVVAAILIIILFLTLGCSFYIIYQKEDKSREDMDENPSVTKEIPDTIGEHLKWNHSTELTYATGFSIDYYEDENENIYKRIVINKDQFLLVPDKDRIPQDILENYVILESPKQVYLFASQVMDMIVAIDAMDTLQFTGLDAKGWYIPEAKAAVKNGDLIYAGKYSAPDYELILSKGCDLAIENTMIYHTPEVKEKLEDFGIPVIVDHSSYESDPLGRMEWVKLYGALMNREQEAQVVFDEQASRYQEIAEAVKGEEKPTVAFFYISSNGDVKVRKGNDYMAKMIESAGGEYVFSDLEGEEGTASSSVTIQMEEFYAAAKDADYIIYNGTIEGELDSLEDLKQKSELISSMKAVKEGHVYCTSEKLYQSTMELGTIMSDIHSILGGEDNMTYFYPLN